MRILIVAMPDSIHVARWVGNLTGLGWDVHLFPAPYDEAYRPVPHPRMAGLTYWDADGGVASRPGRDLLVRAPGPLWLRAIDRSVRPADWRARMLADTIRRVRPDIVHALEFQHAGYLLLDAQRHLGGAERPPTIGSNYGSDIHLFGLLPEHQRRIRDLMALIDVHHCECQRDLDHGRTFGFDGIDAPVIPMGGGWDLDAALVHRSPGPTSDRRTIALKSYEGWAGRAGVALESLRRCGPRLRGYRLELYLAAPAFIERARSVGRETGMEVSVLTGNPGQAPYEEVLALHGRARISIGLSVSDAISTSLLEAMMMGSFPIQSDTGCGNEWLEDGVGGFFVHPEDPQPLTEAILRAASDDELVDAAAAVNLRTVRERLPYAEVQASIVDLYDQVAKLRPASASGPSVRCPRRTAQSPIVRPIRRRGCAA